MSSCFDCSAPVAPEDRFCGNCGLALEPAPRAAGEAAPAPSAPLTSEPGASEHGGTGEAAGPEASNPQPRGFSDELQPTIIESSHGGQAAAAARASEPVEETDAPEASGPAESKSLSTAGSSELSSSMVEDVEATADPSEEEQPTGAVVSGQVSEGDSANAPEPTEQGTGGGASSPPA